jgi:hypothetical protein
MHVYQQVHLHDIRNWVYVVPSMLPAVTADYYILISSLADVSQMSLLLLCAAAAASAAGVRLASAPTLTWAAHAALADTEI